MSFSSYLFARTVTNSSDAVEVRCLSYRSPLYDGVAVEVCQDDRGQIFTAVTRFLYTKMAPRLYEYLQLPSLSRPSPLLPSEIPE